MLLTKNANIKQGQSLDEQMITQLLEQEELRVKNILEFLKKKEGMCADIIKEMLLKNKSAKRSQKQNRRKTRKEKSKGERRNLQILLS